MSDTCSLRYGLPTPEVDNALTLCRQSVAFTTERASVSCFRTTDVRARAENLSCCQDPNVGKLIKAFCLLDVGWTK